MSATSATSARTRCGSRFSRSNKTFEPYSSSPSIRNRKLTGGRGAARVDLAVVERRLERRPRPFSQRIGRLHVVVSVDEQRRRAGDVGTFAGDDGMRLAAEELDIATAQPPQFGGDPFSGRAAILVVRRQCRNGRNAEKLGQLAEQSLLIHGGRNVDTGVAASQRLTPG